MDKIAEKLSTLFGSTPFILVHALWFGGWVGLNVVTKFDRDFSLLTVIVSLEAIFLSLFILRAETIQGRRVEKKLTRIDKQ